MKNNGLKIYASIITAVSALLIAALIISLVRINAVKEHENGMQTQTSEDILETDNAQQLPETKEAAGITAGSEETSKQAEDADESEVQNDPLKTDNVGNIAEQGEPFDISRQIIYGWYNSFEKLGYDADIVFFGDSLVHRSDFRQYFQDKAVVNMGLGGETLFSMQERIRMVETVDPEKIFIMCGVNSLRDDNLDECALQYSLILDTVREAAPQSTVYVLSILPMNSEYQEGLPCHKETTVSFNEKICALAQEREMIYIDLYSLFETDGVLNPEYSLDGVHINQAGYDLWAYIISGYIYG